jgi:hypothetical protein
MKYTDIKTPNSFELEDIDIYKLQMKNLPV